MIADDIASRVQLMPDPDSLTTVSRRMLEQIVAELRAGDAARATVADLVFGKSKGTKR